jgi:molybdopterin synthase catalytic subunit
MSAHHHAIVDSAQAKINPVDALDFVSNPQFGGYNVFIGRVRQVNQGREVIGISYDIFDALAQVHFDEAIARATHAFGPNIRIWLAHAKGRLNVGDVAVVVAVGTKHRDEAFRACRQLIEEVKHRSPIWKQEHYVDGSSEWSEGCSLCEEHVHESGHDHA